MGYAMEDFSARSMNQLLELGKYDALDKLIRSLLHTIDNLDKATLAEQDEGKEKKIPVVSSEAKDSLREHLEKARRELLRSKEDYYSYEEVINHLYDFVDEVNRGESNHQLSHNKANLLRP
jgi:flagellar motility protein MotE (MotC chaperone)